jgi:hypothetical protein
MQSVQRGTPLHAISAGGQRLHVPEMKKPRESGAVVKLRSVTGGDASSTLSRPVATVMVGLFERDPVHEATLLQGTILVGDAALGFVVLLLG